MQPVGHPPVPHPPSVYRSGSINGNTPASQLGGSRGTTSQYGGFRGTVSQFGGERGTAPKYPSDGTLRSDRPEKRMRPTTGDPNVASRSIPKEGARDEKCFANTGKMNLGICTRKFENKDAIVKYVDPKNPNVANEIAILQQLSDICRTSNHPGCLYVVKIYELVSKGNATGIVMNYLNAGNLEKKRDTDLPASQRDPNKFAVYKGFIGRTVVQILTGFTFLHTNHIIHCDIKPDNIMLHRDHPHSQPHAVITDMGLATKKGARIKSGFPGYTLRNPGGPASEDQDLYALTVTMYEMFRPKTFEMLALGHPAESIDRDMQQIINDVMRPIQNDVARVYPAFVSNLSHYKKSGPGNGSRPTAHAQPNGGMIAQPPPGPPPRIMPGMAVSPSRQLPGMR